MIQNETMNGTVPVTAWRIISSGFGRLSPAQRGMLVDAAKNGTLDASMARAQFHLADASASGGDWHRLWGAHEDDHHPHVHNLA